MTCELAIDSLLHACFYLLQLQLRAQLSLRKTETSLRCCVVRVVTLPAEWLQSRYWLGWQQGGETSVQVPLPHCLGGGPVVTNGKAVFGGTSLLILQREVHVINTLDCRDTKFNFKLNCSKYFLNSIQIVVYRCTRKVWNLWTLGFK